ncbi:hypothetical protein [Kitasatospora mediocidica]|uniref:hypothetical protein n=1 Tax=Kitasatospora mediocidica TaxID=58352 RepID=UPI00068B0A0C|nr:hypothetical protein [Kitasatospora mediocidica]
MPAADQRALSADSTLTELDGPEGDELSPGLDLAPGADPGEPESWEIFRVHCPECDRPIALVDEEERLPQHAVLRTAWHPFSPALCPGSGLPADDLEETGPEPGTDTDSALAALLARPVVLDWRTQPFSHAGGPGGAPGMHRVPAMRKPADARLVRH